MRLDDCRANRQTKTKTVLLRRKEGLKEPRFVLGSNPASKINNGNLYCLFISAGRYIYYTL